jgi:hypothetical protein
MITLVLVVFMAVGSMYSQTGFAQPPLSNQQAADKIASSLYTHFPAYDIFVKYRNGKLQLEGNVASEAMARNVVELARNIDGVVVNSVDNQLRIGRQGVRFIEAPDNAAALPTRRTPLPSRTAPVITPETLATLSEAARPETATPSPAITRNGNETAPIATPPTPTPAPIRINADEALLIASADRDENYPNALPSPYMPRPNRNEPYYNYNYENNYENNIAYNNVNNDRSPNYVNVQNTNRPAFRPAVSAPLPLYAPPANAGNMPPYAAAYAAAPYGNMPRNAPPYYVANNQGQGGAPPTPTPYASIPAPTYGYQPYNGATAPMPSAYNNPYLPPYAWPSYATYPNYAQVSYPRSYSVQAWPYIGPFYPYPQAPLGWRQVTLKYDHARWWLDFNDGEPSGPLSPLFRQPMGYRY